MHNKTYRKVKPAIEKDHCTCGVSITELQVRYKRNFRTETHTQGQKNTLYLIYIYIYIYTYICIDIYYGDVYQDVNESFCIIRSSFLDVYIHSQLTKMAR